MAGNLAKVSLSITLMEAPVSTIALNEQPRTLTRVYGLRLALVLTGYRYSSSEFDSEWVSGRRLLLRVLIWLSLRFSFCFGKANASKVVQFSTMIAFLPFRRANSIVVGCPSTILAFKGRFCSSNAICFLCTPFRLSCFNCFRLIVTDFIPATI